MTIVLTPYWSNGVQKLKLAPQREPITFILSIRALGAILIPKFTAPPPPKKGLVPPVLDQNIHTLRCLAQLRSKTSDLEKYIYLSHLRTEDPHMFYKLCLNHMSEITPLIYTPTVGDACVNFSQIYRRPEGMVCTCP